MSMKQKMDAVEAEVIGLMEYLDGRNLDGEIALSALVSALITMTFSFGIDVNDVTDKMLQAEALRKQAFPSEGKSLH
jgi:hypothetical protein